MALLTRLAALEEHDLEMTDAPGASNLDEATEVEASLIEAQENEEELNDMESDIEVAEDAVDAMESLIESLEEAVERGGMTEHEAKLYKLHRKHIYSTMGASTADNRYISTEAFSGMSSRLNMTKLALEEEKGTFTKWWEAIVRFIKNAVSKTVDFVIGLFDTCKALENRAVQLMKQAKNSDTKFEGKLTKAQQKKYGVLFRGGDDKVKSFGDLTGDMISKYDMIGKIVKPLTSAVVLYNRGIGNVLDVLKKSQGEDNTVSNEIAKGSIEIRKLLQDIANKSSEPYNDEIKKKIEDGGKDDDDALREREIIFGNVNGYFLISNAEAFLEKSENGVVEKGKETGAVKIWISYERMVEYKEEDSKLFQYEEMTKESIVSGLGNLSKIIVFWKTLNKDIKEFNHVFSKTISSMDSKARGIGESITGWFKKIISSIKSLFGNASGMSKWYKHCISVFKDILNVISIRMSNAPGDGDDKKKDDDKKDDEKKKRTDPS